MSSQALKRPRVSIDTTIDDPKRARHSAPSSSPLSSVPETPTSPFVEDEIHAAPDLDGSAASLSSDEDEAIVESMATASITTNPARWIRSQENNWLLGNETAASLKGPAYPCKSLYADYYYSLLNQSFLLIASQKLWKPFLEAPKRAMKRVINTIIETWEYTEDAPAKLPFWLATGQQFYTRFFEGRLKDQVRRDERQASTSDAIALNNLLKVRFISILPNITSN
jgi:hypothetical protein